MGTEVLESLTPCASHCENCQSGVGFPYGRRQCKITIASQPPTVVMMVGLQGAGKTTNAAKLAGLMRKQNGNALF